MAENDEPPGISVIEQMASRHHESGGTVIRWEQLSPQDRKRLMTLMETAVAVIPDRLTLKTGTVTATVKTGGCRDALLEDHNQAKGSALYGR